MSLKERAEVRLFHLFNKRLQLPMGTRFRTFIQLPPSWEWVECDRVKLLMATLNLRNVKCLNRVRLRACQYPLSELEAKNCVLYLTSLFTKDNHLVASWRNKCSVPVLSTNRESGNKENSRYCPRGWNCCLFNGINFFPLSLGPDPCSSTQMGWIVTSKQCDWTLDWPQLRLAGFVSVPARMCERNTKSA